MSGHFEHERQRLYGLVDEYIKKVEEDYSATDEPRAYDAMIVVMLEYRGDDGETYTVPTWYAESKRLYIQKAALDACSLRIAGKILGVTSDAEEEDGSDEPDEQ